jgi:hypothetical protein
MQHLATIVFQEHNEQHPHGNCGHGKEIDRDHLADMVCRKVRHVWLGGRRSPRRMRLQLAMNPGCAPQRIGGGYLLDQSA